MINTAFLLNKYVEDWRMEIKAVKFREGGYYTQPMDILTATVSL